jgi:hypothetical protein
MLTYAIFELDVDVVVLELVEGETLEISCDVVRHVSVHVLVLVCLVAWRHPGPVTLVVLLLAMEGTFETTVTLESDVADLAA